MKYLTDVTFKTSTNNWYAPLSEFWEGHKSIVAAEIMDKTSSAGDWEGYFIQKVGSRKVVAIAFSQSNNYPRDGFTLVTGSVPFYAGEYKEKNLIETVRNLYYQF